MLGFYPGSFDPVTKGHLDIIRRALVFCPQLVIGLGENMRKQMLFTTDERISQINAAIKATFTPAEAERVTVTAYKGATVKYAIDIGAHVIVKGLRCTTDYSFEEKMTIVNRRLAPSIDTVFLLTDNSLRDVSSSTVKEMALAGLESSYFDHYLTPNVRDALLERINAQ